VETVFIWCIMLATNINPSCTIHREEFKGPNAKSNCIYAMSEFALPNRPWWMACGAQECTAYGATDPNFDRDFCRHKRSVFNKTHPEITQ